MIFIDLSSNEIEVQGVADIKKILKDNRGLKYGNLISMILTIILWIKLSWTGIQNTIKLIYRHLYYIILLEPNFLMQYYCVFTI